MKLTIIILLFICLSSKAQYEKDTIYKDTVPCLVYIYDTAYYKERCIIAYKLYSIYATDDAKYYIISYRTKDSTGAYKYLNVINAYLSIDLARPKWYSLFNKNYNPNRLH